MADNVAEYIGQIALSASTAAIIAYGAFRWFGKRWIEHRFAQRLEEFKRKQSEFLEQYRYQIDSLFSRITKIHEKEFEVLPEIWRKLQDAHGYFVGIASPLQSWPDLNRFSQPELDAFIEKCELLDHQKEELRQAENKLDYYTEKIYWIRLGDARMKFNDFRGYQRHNRIFLSKDLFDLFHQIELAMIDVEVYLEDPDDRPWHGGSEQFKNLTKDVQALIDKVENTVQERLRFHQA